MEYRSTRSFTMTLAHRAVEDIRCGGFRQLRNYVDMCAALAHKPRQKAFFDYAQKALERTDSCYYSLIERLLETVEEDRICTVGVNLGFSSLIYGASKMKQCSERDGRPFAWITAARCGDPALAGMVPEAEQRGSFTWLLDATGTDPCQAAPLAAANPQSAFGLLARPESLTPEVIETLYPCENLAVLPLLQTTELTGEAVAAVHELRRRRMLYAPAVLLDEKAAEEATDPDWLGCLAQETLICLYARRPGLAEESSRRLRQGIVGTRMESGNPVLLLDWDEDVRYINRILSEHAVFGRFLPQGCSFPLQLGEA